MGREVELGRLDVFLDGIASGRRALLILGEPGLGKTELCREALSIARKRGYRTLVAQPAEVEAALSYAGLHDLLEPMLDEGFTRLPEPQRHALEVSLLLRPVDGPGDRRALATGVLNVLRAHAQSAPVLVAIDDAQWLDASSHSALAFAARRLEAERVGFLLTRRVEGVVEPLELETALGGGVEHLVPSPLSLGALNRLLQLQNGHAFSRPLLRRLRDVSGGNPFFALELARELVGSGATPAAARDLPLPASLREIVHNRLEALPASERKLLVAVAALAHPTLELLSAATGNTLTTMSLKRSLDARIIEVDGQRIRFTHPLLGSVAYADADVAARRRLHRRLAEVVEGTDEAAQHLALATTAPDERVAARLDEAAALVHARGAPDRAAELLTRAVELTPAGDTRKHARRLAAADCWTDAGDASRAVPLLEAAIADGLHGNERAEALARLGWIRCRSVGYRNGGGVFDEAARELPTDPAVLFSIEKGLSWADEMLGDLSAAEEHARRAVDLATGIGKPDLEAQSLGDLGFIEMLRGGSDFEAKLTRAVALASADVDRNEYGGRALWLSVRTRWFEAVVLAWTDQLDASREILRELRAEAEQRGHEHVLPNILNWLGRVECFAGRWQTGLGFAADADEAAVQAGLPVERAYTMATIARAHAHLGNDDAARSAISDGLSVAERLEVVPGRLEIRAAEGFLELSLGLAAEAHATLSALSEQASAAGFHQPATLRLQPDLAESALAVGDLDTARLCLAQLSGSATTLKSPWSCAIHARCEGLVAAAEGDLDAARVRLERALHEHGRLQDPFERARTLLHHGVVLRRLKRRRAARDSIESALATFEALGAPLWAGRASAELARISGRSARSGGILTETEQRIASLVAAGHANKQVAAELYVTVRTVESNLTSIYRKLGISSRSQLAARLNQR